MMKLLAPAALPTRTLWTTKPSAIMAMAQGRLCLQQLSRLSQKTSSCSLELGTGFFGKLVPRWSSALTGGEWRHEFSLARGVCSEYRSGEGAGGRGRGRGRGGAGAGRGSSQSERRFYSSDGERNVESFRGRGRGRGADRGRGRGRGGRSGYSPSYRGSSGDGERFGSPSRDIYRGTSGDGVQREQFGSPSRRFRDDDDGAQREQFGSPSRRFRDDEDGAREPSFRGRGRGRGRASFSPREQFQASEGEESQRSSFRGRGRGRGRASFSPREQFQASEGEESQRSSFRGRGRGRDRGRGRGSFSQREQFQATDGERSSFRGRGRASFGAARGGRGRGGRGDFRDSSPNSEEPRRWDASHVMRGKRGSLRGSTRGGRGGRSFRFGEESDAPPSPRRGQLFEGEEKWQRKVREKKARSSYQDFDSDSDSDDDDDPEEGGNSYSPLESGEDPGDEDDQQEGGVEVWRRKKIGWLCKEIPTLRPTGVVTMLNAQRKWIQSVDTKEVMETLMRRDDILRAHRVLKWTMQQPWYQDDFELNTKMANTLGSNGKLTRMRELFDTILATGRVPDISTYIILIKAYLADASSVSTDEAYKLYLQMEQLGSYQQPASVALTLFQAFTDRKGGAHLRHLHQADALFESMKQKGTAWCMGLTPESWRAMYTGLMHMHSVQGNAARVQELARDMKEAALSMHPDCYTALIRVSSDVDDAEGIFREIVAAGFDPDWRAYVALIQTYGVAGMAEKVAATFEEMEAKKVHVNLNVFEAVIEALARAGDVDGARGFLEKGEAKFAPVLHASYNLLMEWYKSRGMLAEVEEVFTRMKEKKCRPNLQAFNNLMESYILGGQLERAEALYDEMMGLQGFHPNQRTCSLMIEAFGRAELPEKAKGVFEYGRKQKMQFSEEVLAFVADVVEKKEVAMAEKVKPLKLIPEQRDILVGVLLGGANITSHDRNRTYEITFELGDEGSVLLDHLYDMFAEWAQQEPRMDVGDDLTKTHRFSTISHGSLRFYAHQYRPEGEPVIPRLIHRWLNPLSLAYWYMYGGHKCKETGGIILNACQYTSKELTLVVKALKARTVDCVIKKRRSGNVLCFKDESATWVWKLMEPHILDELKEKLRPDLKASSSGPLASEGDDLELKVADETEAAVNLVG